MLKGTAVTSRYPRSKRKIAIKSLAVGLIHEPNRNLPYNAMDIQHIWKISIVQHSYSMFNTLSDKQPSKSSQ